MFHSETTTLNRVAFIVLQPPLIFLLLSQVNLDTTQYLAIGVILSAHSLATRKTICLVSAIKLFGLPALFALLVLLGGWSTHWSQFLVLNAAGPSGTTAFAIAMLYGVNIARIAPVIIWTSLISVLTLAWPA